MRVLIGCECSGTVREAFRARGHDAWSCDLLPAEDGSPFHYQADALEVLRQPFDLLIAHPPCTRLCNSGVLRLYRGGKKANGIDPEKWREMLAGVVFFNALWRAPIKRKCLENPIMHGHAAQLIVAKRSQIIQPWQFGEDASKTTGLHLEGLPLLQPTSKKSGRIVNGRERWSNQTDSGQNRLGPSPTRAAERARTYPGIAAAMAAQWSIP